MIVELGLDARIADGLRAIGDGLSEIVVEGRTIRGRAATGAIALPRVLAALDDAGLPVASAAILASR